MRSVVPLRSGSRRWPRSCETRIPVISHDRRALTSSAAVGRLASGPFDNVFLTLFVSAPSCGLAFTSISCVGMRRKHGRLTLLGLCASALAFVPTAFLSLWTLGAAVSTEDRNADGRPDVWRHFDRRGQVTTVAVDTNFDGRSDVQEFYDGGVLLRRDSDRNFNNQVDLVQEFDYITRDEVRSVSDVDFDGHADLLVLFADGEPAFSELRPRPETSGPDNAGPTHARVVRGDGRLTPLEDSFAQELAVRAVRSPLRQPLDAGAPPSVGLLQRPIVESHSFDPSADLADLRTSPPVFRADDERSPRGPPASLRS